MDSMAEIENRITSLLGGATGFGATVLFDCGEEGAVFVDGSGETIKISSQRAEADCNIAMSCRVFGRIMNGKLSETAAFMQGEMRITGEIGLATLVSDLMRSRAQENISAAS